MAVYGSPAHPKNKLKEGDAVGDLLKPDCFTIGMNNTANCDRAGALLRELHEPFNRNHGCTLFMDVRSLELTEAMGQADAKVQTFDSVGRKEAERTYAT